MSFIGINFIALELIFNISLSTFKEFTYAYPFIHTPRDSWSVGAGFFEYIFFSLIEGEIPWLLIGVFFLTILVTARFFCGWVCPVGFIQDILAILPKKVRKFKLDTDKSVKKIKFWILGLLIIVAIFFGAIHEINLTLFITWQTEIGGFLNKPMAGFSLSEFLFYTLPEGIKDSFAEGSVNPLFSNTWQVIAFLFYIIVLAMSAYYPRFYCRSLCPYGAGAAFVTEYSLLRLGRNPVKCVGRRECGICEKVCPMQIRILDEPFDGFTGEGECILCGRCKEACPHEAIEIKFG